MKIDVLTKEVILTESEYSELVARECLTKKEINMKREEAIKNVLSVIDGLTPNFQETLRVLIPELAETDDEQFESYINEACQFAIKTNEGLSLSLETTKRLNGWLEKQKEQKESVTTEWPQTSNCLKNCKKCLAKCFYRNEAYEEKKPTDWSKEDEKDIYSASCWLFEYAGFISSDNKEKASILYRLATRLKSLRPQSHRKPAEWSEEDKRAIDRACVALRAYANGHLPEILPSELLGYADRLQSLRPQSQWKPSEEQMNVLRGVMASLCKIGIDDENLKVLQNLYNDLTKLM